MLFQNEPVSEFRRNVVTLMKGMMVAQAIPIIISPVLTRIYTPQDFGLFALFVALTVLFGTIANGRYEQAILLPERENDALCLMVLGGLVAFFVSAMLLVVVIWFGPEIAAALNHPGIAPWLYLVPATVLMTGLFNLLSHFSNRQRAYTDLRDATIAKSAVGAAVQVGVGLMKSGVAGLVIGQVVSLIAGTVRLFRTLQERRGPIRLPRRVCILGAAGRYGNFPKFQVPHAALNSFASQMPVYLFAAFFTSGIVGFYALAIRAVFLPMNIIASSAAKVFNERASQAYKAGEDVHGLTLRTLKSAATRVVAPFALFVFFAPDIFSFVFGEAWREAGHYVQILSPWLLMVFIVSMVTYIPALYERQKRALVIEILYTTLRFVSLMTGIWMHSVYVAMMLFSVSGFAVLAYNLYWIVALTKERP